MKILRARIFALRIPLRTSFVHSLGKRDYSDSVVVKLETDTGMVGFGEGVPRTYVTGESVDSCLGRIRDFLVPAMKSLDLPEAQTGTEIRDPLLAMSMAIPDAGQGMVIAWNAAKCAVELSLLDCVLKQNGKPFSEIVPPITDSIVYSVVIPAGTVESARKAAMLCKQHAIQHIKVKVGTNDDRARIATIREALGDSVSLRLDANCAFDVKGALSLIKSIETFRIDCIEQPVPRDLGAMAQITAESPIPVMADESLITVQDARDLVQNKGCNVFNLRLSKNGGIFSMLQIANMAQEARIGLQLGCQVGETAILSAAGRHMALHVAGLKFIEGSYGAFLLEKDITDVPVQFGHKGVAGPIKGSGLGVHVTEDILEKFAVSIVNVDLQ